MKAMALVGLGLVVACAGPAVATGAAEAPGAKGGGKAAAAAAKPGGGKELAGLQAAHAWMMQVGGLIECGRYLKVKASPAWIYGSSGFAFAINVHEVICPSGPTAWPTELCTALAAHAGLAVEGQHALKSQKDFAARQKEIWERTRGALDANQPCLGWEMDVPEWYVVCGYDGEGNYLYRDFAGNVGKRPYVKLGDTEIGVAGVLWVRRCDPADDRTTVRDAILFALDHAAGKHSREKWHTGLSGYDTWIKGLNDPNVLKDKETGFGAAYNAQCWAECRRHAVEFLQEASGRLKDAKLQPHFQEAIARYKTVAEKLAAVAEAFPFDVNDQTGMAQRIGETPRRAKAVEALKAAKDAESAGLKALARIAVELGAKDVDPAKAGQP